MWPGTKGAHARAIMSDHVAKVYKDACLQKGKEYYDYENVHLNPPPQTEKYEIVERVGRGKYSEAFHAVSSTENVCIKVLKPVRKRKIKREIHILSKLSHPNIIQLLSFTRQPHYTLIFPYVNSPDIRTLELSPDDIKLYMYQLLGALDYAHSMGIMHRDVKPHNLLIDSERRVLTVIDWGLAEFYLPGQDYNTRVASRFFKGPELLVDYRYYDYSLDLWSFGCVFAALIFEKEPFFQGVSNEDQLVKIVRVLGTEELQKWLGSIGKTQDDMGWFPKKPWIRFGDIADGKEAVLDACLQYDLDTRLSAKEVMALPYFDQVRSA